MIKKTNIRSASELSLITTGNVIVSFANSLLIAYYFGVSRELEIYFAGTTLFQLTQKLSHSGFLGEVFIPYLIKFNDTNDYQYFVNSLINILVVFSVLLVLLLFLLASPLMHILIPGFSEVEISRATNFYKIVLPLLVITILNSFLGAILQARRKFGISEFSVFWGQLLGLLIFILFVSNFGILALLTSFIITPIIQFLLCSFFLKDIFRKYKLEIKWKEKNVRESISKIIPFIGYTLVTQGVSFAMTSIVSFLPQGSLAILKYAQQMFSKISLISTGPIVTVSFVEFSEAIKRSLTDYMVSFKKIFISSISLSLLITALFIIAGQELITLLFAHGRFNDENAAFLYLGIWHS